MLPNIFDEWRWGIVASIVAGVAVFIYLVHGQLFPQPEFPWEQPDTWHLIWQYIFITALIGVPVVIQVVLFFVPRVLEVSSDFLFFASLWNIGFFLIALQVIGNFRVLSQAAINNPWECMMLLGLLDFLPAWLLAMYEQVSYSSMVQSSHFSMPASPSREQLQSAAAHKVPTTRPYSYSQDYHSDLSTHWGWNSTRQNSDTTGAQREDPLERFRNMGRQSPGTPSAPRAAHRTLTDEQEEAIRKRFRGD